jgi:hypothetical protein
MIHKFIVNNWMYILLNIFCLEKLKLYYNLLFIFIIYENIRNSGIIYN